MTMSFLFAQPTQAGTFFEAFNVFHDPTDRDIYESRYVQFGGCEESTQHCLSESSSSVDSTGLQTPYLAITGSDGEKRGVYSVEGPGPLLTKGKVAFKYTYNFNVGDADDIAIVKVKKVATDEVVYYKEYTENSNGAVDVSTTLPIEAVGDQLQLVFEIDGGEEEDDNSIFYIDNVKVRATAAPRVRGQVIDADGEPVQGATVSLKWRAKDKSKRRVVQQKTSRKNGKFFFHPIKKKRYYTVIVTYEDQRVVKKIKKKLKRGHDKNLTIQLD